MNHAPQIRIPGDTEDLVLELIADVEYVDVAASDQDGDELVFHWSVVPSDVDWWTDETWTNPWEDGTLLWLTRFYVTRDARLDGRHIECLVIDSEGKDTAIEWTVVVEE